VNSCLFHFNAGLREVVSRNAIRRLEKSPQEGPGAAFLSLSGKNPVQNPPKKAVGAVRFPRTITGWVKISKEKISEKYYWIGRGIQTTSRFWGKIWLETTSDYLY